MKLQYSAYDTTTTGTTFDFDGEVAQAEALAEQYAREAFPSWQYEGHGPTIVVADAETSQRIVERRL